MKIPVLISQNLGGGKGLAEEFRNINKLIKPGGKIITGQSEWYEVKGHGVFSLIIKNPQLFIRLFHPKRIKNAVLFILNQEGGFKYLLQRCKDVHLNPYARGTAYIVEPVRYLIDKYRLFDNENNISDIPCTEGELDSWLQELNSLINSNLDEYQSPRISIIIPVYNQLRFTIACIASVILNSKRKDFEIVIADDVSTDQTNWFFTNINHNKLIYIRNEKNVGFLKNCNNSAQSANGDYLVFLNNDTVVLHEWLDELISTFDNDPRIGLVGSKLVYPDGKLQEAGGIVFANGDGWNYGRFNNPEAAEYNYLRDADYCSGASLAIPFDLWEQIGGFDEVFEPAYYEDTDLAFEIRKLGKRVVYQPLSALVHFEGMSNGTSEESGIKRFQSRNKPIFRKKWQKELEQFGKCDTQRLPFDRKSKRKLVFIDATTPTPDKDSGSIDAINLMKIFIDLGLHVVFIPDDFSSNGGYTKDLQRIGVECINYPWADSVEDALKKQSNQIDMVLLCRADIAYKYYPFVRNIAPKAKVVFDTVDLHFLRLNREASLIDCDKAKKKAEQIKEKELYLIRNCDGTIVRSIFEKDLLKQMNSESPIYRIPIVREKPFYNKVPWEERKDVLFIGGFNHSPNVDAVNYFVSDIWPILKSSGFPGKFVVVGSSIPKEIYNLSSDDIVIKGFVKNLAEVFENCRLTVAPLRYGAGMKGKVITSISYGVPCVATEIAIEGTGLVDEETIIVKNDANQLAKSILDVYNNKELWQRLSNDGLVYFEENFSYEKVKNSVENMISELPVLEDELA